MARRDWATQPQQKPRPLVFDGPDLIPCLTLFFEIAPGSSLPADACAAGLRDTQQYGDRVDRLRHFFVLLAGSRPGARRLVPADRILNGT
jgi:hypothetical protein